MELDALPRNIAAVLKHERILDFSSTKIKELPELRDLYNLEYLDLKDCALPKDIENWTKLEHIKYKGHREESPRGLGRMANLKTLPEYIIGEGTEIGELRDLNLLKGKFQIYNLKNVRGGVEELLSANLMEKRNIRHLGLHRSCRGFGDNDDEEEHEPEEESNYHDEEHVLEGLQPHPNLKSLTIDGFRCAKLPSWMDMNNILLSLPNLTEIQLRNCNRYEQIVGFMQIPHLKKLILCKLPELKEWVESPSSSAAATSSLHNSSSHLFPSLEELFIKLCPKLCRLPTLSFPSLKNFEVKLSNAMVMNSTLPNITSPSVVKINGILDLEYLPRQTLQPALKYLEIWGCPKFRGFHPEEENNISPASNNSAIEESVSLRELHIQCPEEWNSLSVDLERITDLEKIRIGWFSEAPGLFPFSAEQFSSFPSLWTFEIDGCSTLKCLPEQLQYLTMLENIRISNMHSDMVALPEWFGNLSSVKVLEILNCNGLKCLLSENEMLQFTSLWSLRIEGISEAEGIQHLIELRNLEIRGWLKLNSLPQQIQYLTSLTRLKIDNFDELAILPEWLGNLSSLEELEIWECKNLMQFPSKVTMKSLTKLNFLSIKSCPLLEERCCSKTGEEWEKISHIEDISIE
ncbi:hypothetical protein MKW92_034098 [Papaver armeniacum]|nr:hypothetical protein MKW92_034098 [Papaver armeniacum]